MVHLSIGMRGDQSLLSVVLGNLFFMVLVPIPAVIAAYRFMMYKKVLPVNFVKKSLTVWQKVYFTIFAVIFLVFFLYSKSSYESLVVLLVYLAWFSLRNRPKILLMTLLIALFLLLSVMNLGNTLPGKFYLLGISIELAIFIIFLPPLIYLIKERKRKA